MKIIFLHRVWPVYGGGETVTICLANEMVKRGVDVHIAYFKDSKITKEVPYIDERIICHKIDNVRFNELSSDFFINKHESEYISRQLCQIVNQEKIDIIHNQWWPVKFLSGIHDCTNAKIITCLHMDVDLRKSFDFTGPKGFLLKFLYPFYRKIEQKKNLWRANNYYKYSDKFVFLAPCFQEKFVKMRGVSAKDPKLASIYNPTVYANLISNQELDEKEKIVLFVGRLSEKHKKITRILNVWKLIEKDKRFNEWKLIVVGDGEDRLLYENIIQENMLQRVYMEGYKKPAPYYQKASIFLMTSAYEGLAMTLVESQQQGVACVVMDTFDSLHDIIENGKNGIITPDGDIDAFREGLVTLMLNEEYRRKLVCCGLQSCQRFAVSKIVDDWMNLYSQVLL